ncbi:MAG: transcription antitermination factor NusB [Planctomycetes bacterium]|nr:transcription antitermination factor NusB [Planctomycetota bacterium]
MARRSRARELALQMLYQADLNADVGAHAVRAMIEEQIPDEDLAAFAWRLFVGTMEWRAMLDERISAVAENWTLARMAPTDRNVLRLAAFEILQTKTPVAVVIDEAVDLARKFGTAQSPQFVNGILDRLVPATRRGENSGDASL